MFPETMPETIPETDTGRMPVEPRGGRRIALLAQYDGTDFHGFQFQSGFRSVQEELEKALTALTNEPHRVMSSSRTDAGVHAAAMPIITRTQTKIPLIGFLRGLAAHLPPDLSVVDVAEVDEAFDVRKSASGKVYRYRLWNGPTRSALRRVTHWAVPVPLDLDAMRAAAATLLGEHDFSAYRAAGCQAKTPIRRITRIDIEGASGAAVDIVVHGNAFLQNMVRILAGTLAEVGRGLKTVAAPEAALRARDRRLAGQTAPPHGLVLEHVLYEPSPFTRPA